MLKRTATTLQLPLGPPLKEEKANQSEKEEDEEGEEGDGSPADMFARKTSEQVRFGLRVG